MVTSHLPHGGPKSNVRRHSSLCTGTGCCAGQAVSRDAASGDGLGQEHLRSGTCHQTGGRLRPWIWTASPRRREPLPCSIWRSGSLCSLAQAAGRAKGRHASLGVRGTSTLVGDDARHRRLGRPGEAAAPNTEGSGGLSHMVDEGTSCWHCLGAPYLSPDKCGSSAISHVDLWEAEDSGECRYRCKRPGVFWAEWDLARCYLQGRNGPAHGRSTHLGPLLPDL